MKEKETKKTNAMVLAKLNYPTMTHMKATIKTEKDPAKALTSYYYFNALKNVIH